MIGTELLKKETETYEREKARLVAESEGKYVLVHDDSVTGVWDTYEDALRVGYATFGLSPFLVKQVRGIDQIHFFARDLVGCQS